MRKKILKKVAQKSRGLCCLASYFSADRRDCAPFLLFDLRPNYGGGNEDTGNLLQKVPCTHCHTQYLQPCSRPSPTHASAGDSWTLMGKSGPVSCGVTAPFSWVLVHTRFCSCPPRVCFPIFCTFWRLYGGVSGGLLLQAYAIPKSAAGTRPYSTSPESIHLITGSLCL